ncbi:2-hydroxyacid dehydrogenase [Chloroflexota bacterium]
MAKHLVYVTRMIAEESLRLLTASAEVKIWREELPPPRQTLLEQVRGVDGLLCLLTDRIDGAIMDSAPVLKVISNMAVGYDNIDIAVATERGIIIGNTPGVLSETTADLAFSLLMAVARRVVEADKYTRKGLWKTWGPMVLLGVDVHNATLGIIGLGGVGAEMAKRARGFNMRVLYYSRTRKQDKEKELGIEYIGSISELLSRSDFVSIHVPLSLDTQYLIGEKEFSIMKKSAILVNTSRGAVVDQKALYKALKNGSIRSAAIDVCEVEPIPPDDPLLELDNIIFAPHIGSASIATRTKMAVMAAENLIAGLKGNVPPNCVNPEVFNKRNRMRM